MAQIHNMLKKLDSLKNDLPKKDLLNPKRSFPTLEEIQKKHQKELSSLPRFKLSQLINCSYPPPEPNEN